MPLAPQLWQPKLSPGIPLGGRTAPWKALLPAPKTHGLHQHGAWTLTLQETSSHVSPAGGQLCSHMPRGPGRLTALGTASISQRLPEEGAPQLSQEEPPGEAQLPGPRQPAAYGDRFSLLFLLNLHLEKELITWLSSFQRLRQPRALAGRLQLIMTPGGRGRPGQVVRR